MCNAMGTDSEKTVSVTETSPASLRKVRDQVPARVWLVSTVVFFERAAYYGAVTLFRSLGLGQDRAAVIGYAFAAVTYVTPLAGGFLADAWLGRYTAIQIGLGCYILGFALLTATAFTEDLYHRGGVPGFALASIFIAMGVGAARPNLSVFLIDQYTETRPKVISLKDGGEAITDRDVTVQFIYNINYWMINIGTLLSILTTYVEKTVGFGFAYSITLGCLAVSVALFYAGRSYYVRPQESRGFLSGAHRSQSSGSEPSDQEDSPSITSTATHTQTFPNMKAALRVCWVFIPFPALTLLLELMNKGLVAQAGQMQTSGIPNDMMMNLNPIAVMVLLPVIQGWLYPFLAKRKIDFSPIYRIHVGLFAASLAIAYTTGLQALIYSRGPCFDRPLQCGSGDRPNEVSLGAQAPVYVLFAFAEIFAFVAGNELAYTKAPAELKSVIQAMFILFGAFGAAVGIGVSFAARDPNLVIVYGSLTGFMSATALIFMVLAPFFLRNQRM